MIIVAKILFCHNIAERCMKLQDIKFTERETYINVYQELWVKLLGLWVLPKPELWVIKL